ncbi:DUF5665 domain-containing protein [Ferviditalea candida]|uniref:DUF5665 domain-containing protein n=1 Tax=Ferviditalea candida TaxID=3108399 RepID=A0ABU5ZED4_9BACL|nr:DUF5665 domain-containing protein [Paenibacillaceae bacterium T2]
MSAIGGRQDDERKLLPEIRDKLAKLAADMEKVQIADYVQLLNSPRKLIWTNLIAGISRGVGIAIGVTVFAAGILYVLQLLGALNLPIIGDFIAELIKIVQAQLEGRRAY